MKTALTIGGSDPTGGAGIQADLKTFKSFGVYGLSIPTALTAQNTNGVTGIYDLPLGFFSNQLDTLLKDIKPDALKTGMLSSSEIVKPIAEKIKQYSLKNLVIDPVTVSSTGVPLVNDKALEFMKDYLFPLAKAITPNIYEASLFTGINIQDEEDMKKAAIKLKGFGPETVIITGGHLEKQTIDLLLYEGEFLSLQREKIEGEYHGTGCVFSSAITACLALGYDVREATVKANEFVWKAIKSAFSLGKGMKILNI
ncbi:MAG: bifunctional hydroxymethylpyrimidine kinase/phosphomethylpyrimidine kinase [Thermodesulfovibrionia bacterium]|nr:bifunctional hydroxymethylpyrimidine kinase/phosphomethylpyrimidine kinase [Thermodesulfovibrionia bacterium]